MDKPTQSASNGSAAVVSQLKEVAESLFLLSLPLTIDRTKDPRTNADPKIGLCILGSSKQHLDVLLEGGECCPGDMMLIVSPSWLVKSSVVPEDSGFESGEGSTSTVKSQQLLVRKAITFHRGGTTYLDVFQPLRRVTYFINEMPYEFDDANLDCPMNGSSCISRMLEDPLLLKIEMSKMDVRIQECLAFCYKPSSEFIQKFQGVDKIKVVELNISEEDEEDLSRSINAYLGEWMENRMVILTKKINGSISQLECDKTSTELLELILADTLLMTSGDYIVIEQQRMIRSTRVDSLEWTMKSKRPQVNEQYFSISAHVSVCRGLDDQPLVSKIHASVTSHTTPSLDSASFLTLETALADLGITDLSQVRHLRQDVESQAKAVMKKIIDIENSLNGLNIGQRTDFLEITFKIERIRDVLTPMLKDVSCHYTTLWVEENEMWNRTLNYRARSVIHVMVMRSHSFLLKNKWILILPKQIMGRQDFWTDARKYGVKVAIVTPNPNFGNVDLADMVVIYDISDRTKDKQHAKNILTILNERNIQISGCISLYCGLTMLAAMIREQVGARGPSEDAGHKTNEKYLTYSTLLNSPSSKFVKRAYRVTSSDELKLLTTTIGFPAFMKPDIGGGAVGAAMVSDMADCLKHYQELEVIVKKKSHVSEHDSSNRVVLTEYIEGSEHIISHVSEHDSSNRVVLTEYIEGSEHIIDVVMFDGQLTAAYIRDVAPPTMTSFVPTANSLPSRLPTDRSRELVRASHQCCMDIGLKDGIFNVEMRLTPVGPKLIEINTRVGGYMVIPLIRQCYDEDLVMLEHLINCGIKPTVVHLPPLRHAFTLLLKPAQHYKQLMTPWVSTLLEDLNNSGQILYRCRDIEMSPYDKVIAIVGVCNEDRKAAKQTLLNLAQTLGLDTPGFPCCYFLNYL